MPLFVIYGLLWVFLVALATDLLCLDFQRRKALQVISQLSLLFAACVLISLIYLIDKYNGDYVIWAFILSFISLVVLEVVLGKKLRKKIGHLIGWVIITLLIGNLICYTRYDLETKFFKPCWSPNGKQIAFFMQKNLIWYRLGLPFSFWSPNTIWSKNYLCAMDYNGGNFKQIRQTEQATDEISWSGSGEILYTQDIRLNVDIILQRKIMYTSADGKETGTLYETAKIPTKTATKENGIILDPWLSKDQRYLGYIFYYQLPYVAKDGIERQKDKYRLVIKDLQANKDKIVIDQEYEKYVGYGKLYGAYDKNLIVYEAPVENQWTIYDLNKGKQEIISGKIEDVKISATLDMWTISPDRKMYADAEAIATWHADGMVIRKVDNKIIGKINYNTKRSYLFNIFSK